MGFAEVFDQLVAQLFQVRAGCFIIQHIRRMAGVAALANLDVDGDFAQERNVEFFGPTPRTAAAKDVVFLAAIRTDEAAHVFHHPQDWDADLAKHGDGLHGVQ